MVLLDKLKTKSTSSDLLGKIRTKGLKEEKGFFQKVADESTRDVEIDLAKPETLQPTEFEQKRIDSFKTRESQFR